VLRPQIAMPIDDAAMADAIGKHVPTPDDKTALDAVEVIDKTGWDAQRRIEQDAAVDCEASAPLGEV
jgi:hypothetical protein